MHKKAKEFQLEDQNGLKHKLSDYLNKKIILYFYPEDMTPGCTIEAQNFRDAKEKLEKHNVVIIGISPDDINKHKKFCDKEGLNYTLLSDPDKKVIQQYDLWVEKNIFGKKVMGVQRDTFLIDEKGYIIKHYKKVKPEDHIKEILKDLDNLD